MIDKGHRWQAIRQLSAKATASLSRSITAISAIIACAQFFR
jgi:hypothetical protein